MVKGDLKPSRKPTLARGDPTRSLHGVNRADWRGRPQLARALGAALAERGQIAYCVVGAWPGEEDKVGPERRASARELMRLRSAKLLDGAYRFVCECRICDRSQHGLRLLLLRNVKLTRRLAVHIDETSEVRAAKIVWRRGPTLGVRLGDRAHPGAIKPWDRHALRERYYGILD